MNEENEVTDTDSPVTDAGVKGVRTSESDDVELPQVNTISIPTKWLLPAFAFMLGGGGGSLATLTTANATSTLSDNEVRELQSKLDRMELKIGTIEAEQSRLSDTSDDRLRSIEAGINSLIAVTTELTIEVRTNHPSGEGVRRTDGWYYQNNKQEQK